MIEYYKHNFEVKGKFYIKDSELFREVLEIRDKRSDKSINREFLVIMMNPGSSEPCDELYDNVLKKAKPDDTQYQIMKVMERCNIKFVRVLNLGSNCESKSSKFIDLLSKDHSNIISVFNDEILVNHYIKDFDSVILAWGASKKLQPLIEKVIPFVKDKNCFAVRHKKQTNSYRFYHPLPRFNKDRINWVNDMAKSIISTQTIVF